MIHISVTLPSTKGHHSRLSLLRMMVNRSSHTHSARIIPCDIISRYGLLFSDSIFSTWFTDIRPSVDLYQVRDLSLLDLSDPPNSQKSTFTACTIKSYPLLLHFSLCMGLKWRGASRYLECKCSLWPCNRLILLAHSLELDLNSANPGLKGTGQIFITINENCVILLITIAAL